MQGAEADFGQLSWFSKPAPLFSAKCVGDLGQLPKSKKHEQ
jgi:hypothetical protein